MVAPACALVDAGGPAPDEGAEVSTALLGASSTATSTAHLRSLDSATRAQIVADQAALLALKVCPADACGPGRACQRGLCARADAACDATQPCLADEACSAGQCVERGFAAIDTDSFSLGRTLVATAERLEARAAGGDPSGALAAEARTYLARASAIGDYLVEHADVDADGFVGWATRGPQVSPWGVTWQPYHDCKCATPCPPSPDGQPDPQCCFRNAENLYITSNVLLFLADLYEATGRARYVDTAVAAAEDWYYGNGNDVDALAYSYVVDPRGETREVRTRAADWSGQYYFYFVSTPRLEGGGWSPELACVRTHYVKNVNALMGAAYARLGRITARATYVVRAREVYEAERHELTRGNYTYYAGYDARFLESSGTAGTTLGRHPHYDMLDNHLATELLALRELAESLPAGEVDPSDLEWRISRALTTWRDYPTGWASARVGESYVAPYCAWHRAARPACYTTPISTVCGADDDAAARRCAGSGNMRWSGEPGVGDGFAASAYCGFRDYLSSFEAACAAALTTYGANRRFVYGGGTGRIGRSLGLHAVLFGPGAARP